MALLAVMSLIAAAIYVFGGGQPASHRSLASSTTLVPVAGETAFVIAPSTSEARFTIQEVLFGSPNTVVGTTNQVEGEILVNKSDPSKSRVGQIRVDLSTLATNNNLRNRTLQSRILETDQPGNQFATFETTALKGMPATVAVGQTVSFQIVGQLTIHQVTRTETFDVQMTAQSETTLSGTARTTVRYADFNLVIPNVPSVSDVSEDVALALSFTANAQS